MTSRCHSRSNRWMCVAASFGSDNPSIHHLTARLSGCGLAGSWRGRGADGVAGFVSQIQGRFQLQTKTDGPIEMIVVDFDAPDRLRATARFDQDRLNAMLANNPRTGELIGSGYLAMTIDQGTEQSRYQGVVALEGQGFEEAAHEYFRQSEQIPTRVRLAVAEQFENGRHTYRAGGSWCSFCRHRPSGCVRPTWRPGHTRGPSLSGLGIPSEDDAWAEAKALIHTVEDHELIDPSVSSERLLYRLFHEHGVRVFEGQSVHEECRCSETRVMSMMRRFSPEDRRDMVGDNGRIGITCEFCSRFYDLDPVEVEAEIARAEAE